ncbi:MAG: hypothetical protein ACREH4_05880 [Vitreimonas sp.]
MLRAILAGAAVALGLVAAAAAQESADLPAVQSMNCQQMIAEMTTAGQTMNSQLDPQFAVEAQAMMQEAQRRTPQPGDPAQNVQSNIARMEAQGERLNNATAGIDMARMQAMSERFGSQNCQAQVPPR